MSGLVGDMRGIKLMLDESIKLLIVPDSSKGRSGIINPSISIVFRIGIRFSKPYFKKGLILRNNRLTDQSVALLIKNFAYIVFDVWSSYSTSASANAVFSTTDQSTGLAPLYKPPLSINFPSSATMAASAS